MEITIGYRIQDPGPGFWAGGPAVVVFQAEWKRILQQKRFRISGLGFRAWTLLVLEGVGAVI